VQSLWGGLRPRLLLVEDDVPARRSLKELLEAEGVAVVADTGDGFGGVQLARELEPDIVLMDLRLPGMGGLEAARLIAESLPFTQVIVLTAYDGPLPTRSAQEAGVYAYLVKGCSIQLMRDVIEQAWHFNAGIKSRAQAASSTDP
jgi:DNA-binding NarL/FixJ family response regulator